jgi:hypothetical protein
LRKDKSKREDLPPIPALPQEISDAAHSGTLVIFVGAGISKLAGLPTWVEFASAVLQQLVKAEIIDYREEHQIKSSGDARKWLSIASIIANEARVTIDYKSIFQSKQSDSVVYEHLNKCKCSFVTTNYDKLVSPESLKSSQEKAWRYYRKEKFSPKVLDKTSVVHLHGCVDDSQSMVITTKDYLNHYSQGNEVCVFLEHLFSNKTVLFLGYGMAEIEILEYILKYSSKREKRQKKIFILQGFYTSEDRLFCRLKRFYEDPFKATLIGFSLDKKNYKQQEKIIETWLKQLRFGNMSLADEAEIMLEELNG